MLKPVDCYKLHIHDIIPRAITVNATLKVTCKNTIPESSNGILRNVHVTHRKSGKKNREKQRAQQNKKCWQNQALTY